MKVFREFVNKPIMCLIYILNTYLALGEEITIYGPGLQPKHIVMPARYFFINFTSFNELSYSSDLSRNLAIEISGKAIKKDHCRIWMNTLDRKDGTFIVRYKLYETCMDITIGIYYKKKHIANSPIKIEGPIQPDQCNCPNPDFQLWLNNYNCSSTIYQQIDKDLLPFQKVVMKEQIKNTVNRYHKPEIRSFCHYVIKDNKIYRDCYGKHVGFNMFADNILLSLSRKTVLPDMEMVINLGDWPLIHKNSDPVPMFSWCGSDDTLDIVMPTYDITESTLENMGRVTLDTLSVQGNVALKWKDRESRAIWRGRDSRAERLRLIDIARANPDLINASLTNFFFFREKEAQYGPKVPHISFFKFFDYKYQINVDGTVAAYRFPYLLTGGGLVLKQDSSYYEHFYGKLKEWEHYVPVKSDLSDLTEKIKWAMEHDEEAQAIAKNARHFANENLLPQHIICYHAVLFSEWSKRIIDEVEVREGMTHVPQSDFECQCGYNNNNDLIHEDL